VKNAASVPQKGVDDLDESVRRGRIGMTRVIFAHDHRFIVAGEGIGSPGQFPYQAWQRYLSAFGEVRVIARRETLDQEGLPAWANSSAGNRVSFRLHDTKGVGPFLNPSLRSNVKSEVAQADAVIARLPSEIGLRSVHYAERFRKPWAVEVVGCAWDAFWNYGSPLARVYAPILFWRMRRIVSRAPYALYVTSEFLQGRYPCRGRTVSASNVQIPRVASKPKRYYPRKRHQELVFGFIGSLQCRYKGLHVAMRALSKARGELGAIRLRILGRGERRSWIRMAKRLGLDDSISFEGTRPGGQGIFNWLDEIDIFLQPSLQEGLPRTVLEAMSRGLAVLASSAGGTKEVLDREAIHPPGNAEELAGHLRCAGEDYTWLRQQGRRNLEKARSYTNDILEARRRDFWQEFSQQGIR
jgi:glycosyltransferase involved in cell wall biosynthesis